MKALLLIMLCLYVLGVYGTSFDIHNSAGHTVDVFYLANAVSGQPAPQFIKIATIANGATVHYVPPAVAFNIRIGSTAGKSWFEWTINGWNNLDWYDLSVIVGYDYGMSIAAPAGCPSVTCRSRTCADAYKVPSDNYATKACGTGKNYVLTIYAP